MITDLPFVNQKTQVFSTISTKLHVPVAPPSLVQRPRLMQQLNQSIQYKLVLVSAPAGFGKTTLLSDWSQRSEWPVAWVSLDAADNDPIHFWSYVITALDKLDADLEHILDLLRAAHTDITYHLTGLINALAAISDDFVLVLDDYHCIENNDIHTALTFLLDYLPPQMHLILAGRVAPPLPLARWRARSQLMELGSDDLRFSQEETQTLLRQTINVNLSAEEIAMFQQRTEGWVAGLHLAALTAGGSANITASFLNSFRGDHRYIVDYLATEVLQQQPEPIRNFLLSTAVLEYLQSDLCDAVTGRDDSRSVLAEIERRNLFIIPLCQQERTYRYHHLFADFLRSQLRQKQADQLPALHRQAAAWYQAGGDIGRAIQHTLAAGDFTEAADLVEQVVKQRLVLGEFNTLLGWFKALPEAVIHSRPKLCLFYAWTLTHAGRFDEATHYLDRLDQADGPEVKIFIGGKAAIQARMAVIQGDPDRIVECCKLALAHIPAELIALRSEISLDLAFAQEQLAANLEEVQEAFEEAIACNRSSHHPRAAMMASYYLGNLYLTHGQLQPAAQVYQQALQWAQRYSPPAVSLCWAHVGLGQLLYEWNRLDEAHEHLQQALQLAQQSGEVKVLIYSHRALAYLYQARDELTQAQTSLRQAEEIAQQTNIVSLIEDVAVDQMRLWLKEGQLDTAAGWVQQCGYSLDPEHPEARENAIVILLALAQGISQHVPLPQEIVPLLQQRCAHEQSIEHNWQLIQNMGLLAVAYSINGHTAKARETFQQTLALAQPAGFIRTLIDQGAAIATLLRQCVEDKAVGGYAGQLLAALGKETIVTITPLPTKLPDQSLVEPLRQRELEVLQLISTGRSNKEIADEMILAVSTVKWHLKNIYGKLQVNNRTQALARARELNLL
ncbi:MAG: tetratricopeptide repeat protein [Anaerolineae bacterium]|nr:tetratricopeptide repeat protein [Anaerolineae bacterium]